MSHLSDGRLIYAHDGTIYQQATFGSATLNTYSNAPSGDYGFVTGNGFVGAGGFAAASVYSYSASSTSSSFTSIATKQNYGAVSYNGTSILMSGGNGSGSVSEIGHLNSSGTYTSIVENVSTYSGGFTLDSTGNLYVADNDDSNIYSFTASQVTNALLGTALSVSDGELVTNLGVSGSLAIDSLGRLYVTGWESNGIQVFDLNTEQAASILPGAANTNYSVSTFSDGANDYVSWLNWSGYDAGDSVTYGYNQDSLVVVPEPATSALVLGLMSLTLLVLRRRRG